MNAREDRCSEPMPTVPAAGEQPTRNRSESVISVGIDLGVSCCGEWFWSPCWLSEISDEPLDRTTSRTLPSVVPLKQRRFRHDSP